MNKNIIFSFHFDKILQLFTIIEKHKYTTITVHVRQVIKFPYSVGNFLKFKISFYTSNLNYYNNLCHCWKLKQSSNNIHVNTVCYNSGKTVSLYFLKLNIKILEVPVLSIYEHFGALPVHIVQLFYEIK